MMTQPSDLLTNVSLKAHVMCCCLSCVVQWRRLDVQCQVHGLIEALLANLGDQCMTKVSEYQANLTAVLVQLFCDPKNLRSGV